MKRFSVFASVAVLAVLLPGLLPAQSDPEVGTWKLNLAKSTYSGTPAPKSVTTTIEAQGAGFKVGNDGVAADGSHITYGFTAAYDGKDVPITGAGAPNGADTISLKRTGPSTHDATLKKAGKVVLTAHAVISKDGKTRTLTSKGTNASGQPTSTKAVYDKQ